MPCKLVLDNLSLLSSLKATQWFECMKWLGIAKDSFRKDCLPAAPLAHDRVLQLDVDIVYVMPNKSKQHTKIYVSMWQFSHRSSKNILDR